MKIALLFALVALFAAAASAQSCTLTVSQTLASSWTSNGQAFSQWSVTLTNSGSQAVLGATLTIAQAANLDQIWNVERVGATNNYNLPSYIAQNGGVAAAATYQFGYIIKSSAQATITVAASCAAASPAASSAASPAVSPPIVASSAPSPAASAAASPAASAAASPSTSTCRASVSAVPRAAANGGVWTDGPFTYQIVDLVATNNGAQLVTNIRLAITLSAGAIISQSWELTVADGVYSIPTPYGPLQLGATQGAGFIVRSAAGASGPASASVTVAAVTCSGSATSPAASPAASASPVVVASSAPQPSNAPAGCAVRLTIAKRANDNFTDANGYNQAFDLTATNIGSRPVTLAQLKVALAANVAVAQFFELARIDASTFALTAPTQYGPIQVGASATAAIIAATKTVGASDVATPTVTLSAVNCQ